MEKFIYIDHPSDIGIEFYGDSPEELFENAATGMFSIIGDLEKVDPVKKKSIVIRRRQISSEDLLVLWLEELLFIFDTENMIFSDFKVKSIDFGREPGEFVLEATASGEKVDLLKHDIKVGIKAPTYHRLEIRKEAGMRWIGTVIFDV